MLWRSSHAQQLGSLSSIWVRDVCSHWLLCEDEIWYWLPISQQIVIKLEGRCWLTTACEEEQEQNGRTHIVQLVKANEHCEDVPPHPFPDYTLPSFDIIQCWDSGIPTLVVESYKTKHAEFCTTLLYYTNGPPYWLMHLGTPGHSK